MKVYYANMASVKGLEAALPKGYKIGVLESFYGLRRVEIPPFCDWYFLDSGAYSAHRKNEQIDIEAYGKFVKQYLDVIKLYANLDVIGDAEGTMKNQLRLEKMDLCPLPCYHGGEPISYLQRYVEEYDYIALGGVAQMGTNQERLNRWLETCWDVILEVGGGKTKVHGFGIQAEDIMMKFPWYSVDASSCHMQARYGGIRTRWGWMKINPDVAPSTVQWIHATPEKLKRVKEWVAESCPFINFEEAQIGKPAGTLLRCGLSIWYYEELAKKHDPTLYTSKRKGRLLF